MALERSPVVHGRRRVAGRHVVPCVQEASLTRLFHRVDACELARTMPGRVDPPERLVVEAFLPERRGSSPVRASDLVDEQPREPADHQRRPKPPRNLHAETTSLAEAWHGPSGFASQFIIVSNTRKSCRI
jgi:hypothetical protein